MEEKDVVVSNKKAKRYTIAATLFLFCLFILFTYITISEYDERSTTNIIILNIFGVISLIASILIWLYWKKSRIIFHSDKVEEISLFRTYVIHYSNIEGYRQKDVGSSRALSLIPLDKKKRIIELDPKYSEIKSETLDWLYNSFKDLDKLDFENEKKEIEANFDFGISKQDRNERLNQAKKISRILYLIAAILFFWVMLRPQPYQIAMWTLLIFPFIGHLAVKYFRGLIKYDTSSEKIYPNIAPVIIVPGGMLTFRSFIDFAILDWTNFWLPFILIILAQMTIINFNVKKINKRAWKMFDVVFICTLYSFGATIQLNWLLADDLRSTYNVEVLEKRISKGSPTTYHFKLTPWELNPEIEEERVYRDVYETYNVGDTISVVVGYGFFNIPWYDIE